MEQDLQLLLVAGIVLALCYLFGLAEMFRFVTYGPVIGSVIGAVQTAAAVQVWIDEGQPDFYFGGRSNVSFSYALMIVGGGIVGVPFGALLAVYEHVARRRIPLGRFLLVTCLLVYVAARVVVQTEFSRRRLFNPFAVASFEVFLAGMTAILFAKPQVPAPPEISRLE